jgi:hypothetical protein
MVTIICGDILELESDGHPAFVAFFECQDVPRHAGHHNQDISMGLGASERVVTVIWTRLNDGDD